MLIRLIFVISIVSILAGPLQADEEELLITPEEMVRMVAKEYGCSSQPAIGPCRNPTYHLSVQQLTDLAS